jgi:hypothetical protein
MPAHLFFLDLITQMQFGKDYKLWNSLLCRPNFAPSVVSVPPKSKYSEILLSDYHNPYSPLQWQTQDFRQHKNMVGLYFKTEDEIMGNPQLKGVTSGI